MQMDSRKPTVGKRVWSRENFGEGKEFHIKEMGRVILFYVKLIKGQYTMKKNVYMSKFRYLINISNNFFDFKLKFL